MSAGFFMSDPRPPSFEQLQVLLTVVEEGSFTAAGRKLGRATSAISYAIDTIETQLGLAVFARGSTKRPTLTAAGAAVVAEAKALGRGMDTLLGRVKGILDGLETEITLAVDVLMPIERVVDVLHDFEVNFPTVTLRLQIEALGTISQLVHEGAADLGVGSHFHTNLDRLRQYQIEGVELIPVAAPSHPIVKSQRADPRDHVQLVLTDRSQATAGRDFGVVSPKTWRLGDLGAKHALLLAGIGWGSMPEPMVRADLAAGRLTQIRHLPFRSGMYQLLAIHKDGVLLGPAGRWLIERFIVQRVQPKTGSIRGRPVKSKAAKRPRLSPK
jgi:DNA-binding transcriptional LysR family regulator